MSELREPFEAEIESLGAEELYMQEISRAPLLNHWQEISFAQTIERGERARVALEQEPPPIPPNRQREFDSAIKLGQAAHSRMVQSNLRLVFSVAKKSLGKGLPLLDLVQEGNLGLVKALEKFDWRKGWRFSTYASWWIMNSVDRAIKDQSRVIRIPIPITDKARAFFRRVDQAESFLGNHLGYSPSLPEVAEEVGVSTDELEFLSSLFSHHPDSLDEIVPEAKEERHNLIADDTNITQDNISFALSLKRDLKDILDDTNLLNPRERDVVILRFDLSGEGEMAHRQVGERLGVHRETARQDEIKAMEKLRAPEIMERLRDYLE